MSFTALDDSAKRFQCIALLSFSVAAEKRINIRMPRPKCPPMRRNFSSTSPWEQSTGPGVNEISLPLHRLSPRNCYRAAFKLRSSAGMQLQWSNCHQCLQPRFAGESFEISLFANVLPRKSPANDSSARNGSFLELKLRKTYFKDTFYFDLK